MALTSEEYARRLQVLESLGIQLDSPEPESGVGEQETPEEEVLEAEEEGSDDEDNLEPPPIVRDPNLVSPYQLYLDQQRRKQQARNAQMQHAMGSAVDADDDTPFFFDDQRKGEFAASDVKFVPFGAVARYCYNSVPPQWLQPLASDFFDKNQIYNRAWEFYFTPPSVAFDAIPFIALHQLQTLISEINAKFPDASITLRQDIIVDFEDLSPSLQRLRPRFAGIASSRSQYNSLVSQISREPNMVFPNGDDRSLKAFKAKMQAAADAHKAKGKRGKATKTQDFMVKRQGMVKETLQAQRYLGLLGKKEESLLLDISNASIKPLDVDKPAPHPFEHDPIFIAIDVEAYEKPPRMVTEVGVATLDTRDLQGHAPGDIGKNWHQHIRARHFRIIEYKDRINRDFVQGCPGSFEFGDSEFVSKNNIASVLASCFREPFSKKANRNEDRVDTPISEEEKRSIVLVGHDLSQDVNYCHEIGFSVLNRGNMLDPVDTVNLYRTFAKDPSARALGTIINEFDMTGWHLHNAGNDAVYTLHAMLAICVKIAANRGNEEAEKELKEKIEQRIEAQVENARERAQADSEGWESPDDGGVELPPVGDEHFRFHTVGGAVLDV